jgi:hypothetical protein
VEAVSRIPAVAVPAHLLHGPGAELDVSRVPLGEAVPPLERGFVVSSPRRSAVVTRWDAKAIDDLFDVRLGLEVGRPATPHARWGTASSTTPGCRDGQALGSSPWTDW